MDKLEEVRVPVQVVQVKLRCPYCNEGFLEVDLNAAVITTHPPQYSRICSSPPSRCNSRVNISGKRYPYVEYREII